MKDIISLKGVVTSVSGKGAKIKTPEGEVHVWTDLMDGRIVWGAEVVLEATESDKTGDERDKWRSSFVAERIKAVRAHEFPVNVEAYATIDWFNGKERKGRLTLVLGSHPFVVKSFVLVESLHFAGNICPDKRPVKGEAVGVFIKVTPTGLVVSALESNANITAAVEALRQTPSEDGKRRYVTEEGMQTVNPNHSHLVPAPPKWDD